MEIRVPTPWRTTIEGVDWSQSQVSYSVTRDSYQAGATIKTGQLTLNQGPDNPASLNTRVNHGTFRAGRLVNVELWDGAVWQQHPMFPLRISVKPLPPAFDEKILTLDLVCELGYYLNLPVPDEEKLIVPTGGTMAYHTAVQNLLEAGEVPAANINLPTAWSSLNLNFSPPKEGGSWVQMAIDLAEVENQCLYTGSDGLITSRAVDVAPAAAALTINADSETIDYRPYQENASPPHKVTVYGNGRATSDGGTTVTKGPFTVYGSYSGLITGAGGRGILSQLTETRTIVETTLVDEFDGQFPVTIVTDVRVLRKPAGLVNEAIEPRIQIITAEEKTTLRIFNAVGLLVEERISIREPAISLDDDANPKIQLRDSSQITTIYDIANEEYIETIRTITNHPKSKIFPETEDKLDLVKARVSEQNWRLVGPESYVFWQNELIPKYQARPELVEDEDDAYQLVGDPNFIPPTENIPPAPQTLDSAISEDDEQFTGTAIFTDPGGTDVRVRTWEETLAGYCVSNNQCESNAQTKGAMFWGRNLGSEVTIGFRNDLLSRDYPLWRLDVIEPPIIDYRDSSVVEASYRQSFLTDAETWEHNSEGLDIAYLGIWVGTSDNAITAPTSSPYVQPVIVATAVTTTDKTIFSGTPALDPGTTVFYSSSTTAGIIYHESLEYEVVGDGINPSTWELVRGVVAASVSPTTPYVTPLGVDHEWRVINAENNEVTEVWVPNSNATAWIQEY